MHLIVEHRSVPRAGHRAEQRGWDPALCTALSAGAAGGQGGHRAWGTSPERHAGLRAQLGFVPQGQSSLHACSVDAELAQPQQCVRPTWPGLFLRCALAWSERGCGRGRTAPTLGGTHIQPGPPSASRGRPDGWGEQRKEPLPGPCRSGSRERGGRGERSSSELFPPLYCQLIAGPSSTELHFHFEALECSFGSSLKCFAEPGPRRSRCSGAVLNCVHVRLSLGFQQRLGAKGSSSAMPRTRGSQAFYWSSSKGLGLYTAVTP